MKNVSLISRKDIEEIVNRKTDGNLSSIDGEFKELKKNMELLERRISLLEYKLSKLEVGLFSKSKEKKEMCN